MKPFLGDEGNPFLAWYGWPSTPTKNDVLTMALRMGQKYRGLCFHQVRGFFTRLKKLLLALIQKWGTEWGFKNKPLHLGDLTTK
jgi:hypothetical protein